MSNQNLKKRINTLTTVTKHYAFFIGHKLISIQHQRNAGNDEQAQAIQDQLLSMLVEAGNIANSMLQETDNNNPETDSLKQKLMKHFQKSVDGKDDDEEVSNLKKKGGGKAESDPKSISPQEFLKIIEEELDKYLGG